METETLTPAKIRERVAQRESQRTRLEAERRRLALADVEGNVSANDARHHVAVQLREIMLDIEALTQALPDAAKRQHEQDTRDFLRRVQDAVAAFRNDVEPHVVAALDDLLSHGDVPSLKAFGDFAAMSRAYVRRRAALGRLTNDSALQRASDPLDVVITAWHRQRADRDRLVKMLFHQRPAPVAHDDPCDAELAALLDIQRKLAKETL